MVKKARESGPCRDQPGSLALSLIQASTGAAETRLTPDLLASQLDIVANVPVEKTPSGFRLGIFKTEDVAHSALPPMTALYACVFCAMMVRGYASNEGALLLCKVRDLQAP